MTRKEHDLIVMMFSRTYERLQVITDTLKSRGLWTDDDQRAFSEAVHVDDEKLLACLRDAQRDYSFLSQSLGVVTDEEI